MCNMSNKASVSFFFFLLLMVQQDSILSLSGRFRSSPVISESQYQQMGHRNSPRRPSVQSSLYQANGSLVGMVVRCSGPAKRCLDIQRLVENETGRCYPLGDNKPCQNASGTFGVWALDPTALSAGRVQGHCHRSRGCHFDEYRMAYDGKCYKYWFSNTDICDGKFVLHPFGDHECISRGTSPVNTHSEPSGRRRGSLRDGLCKLPPLNFRLPRWRVRGGQREKECAAQSAVLATDGSNTCLPLLQRHGCGEDQKLVLDTDALKNGTWRGRCIPRNHCGTGRLYLRGLCRSISLINDTLCPGEELTELCTGEWECLRIPSGHKLALNFEDINENEFLVYHNFILMEVTVKFALRLPGRDCVRNNRGNCLRQVEEPTHGPIDLGVED